MGRQLFFAGTALAAVCVIPGAALAQATAAAAPASADTEGLQEITVFAQKRTESIQDIPVAVTAVSAEEIADWGLHSTNDLQEVTPNLTIGSVYQGTTPQLTLRGVGVNDGIETTSPSVGTYIDQIYQADASAAAIQMFDMGRVEVLRGPQGTLYGKNTNGGALNLYSQRPTQDFQGEVDIEAGNYSERSATAILSGPILGPELTGRFSAFYKDRDGYGEVLAPGPVEYSANDVWAEHDYGVRGQLLYKPTDNMEWLLLLANGRNRITYGWPVLGLRNPANPAVDCANPFSGTCVDAFGEHVYGTIHPYSTIQDKLSSTTPVTTLGTLQGTWTLGSVALTSVTGYMHTHTRLTDDGASDYIVAAYPGDLFFFDQNKHSDAYSEELRLASVGKQRFNWTTGIYVSTETRKLPVSYEFNLSPATTDIVRTTSSYAAFAQGDFAVTDNFKIVAGLRYSDSTLDSTSTSLGGGTTVASKSWGSVGGRFSVEERLNDSTMTYASYNRGFKEGNINVGIYGGAIPATPAYVKPEYIDAFEVGIKSDVTRMLRINGDVFYNKLKDMQVAGTDPTNLNFPTVTNAAKATTYGAELELTARPIPDLTMSASYGYLHARFDDYFVLSVFNGTLINASGKEIPLSPTNTFSTQIDYLVHLGDVGTLTPRLNYSYRSTQDFTPEGFNPRASQTGYGLLGAGLKFDSPGNLEVDIWGRNLTNKAYLIDSQPGDSFNGTDFLTYGQPRMYGVTLRKKF